MNRKIMIIGLALLTMGAVSCKKDYVCDCHIDYEGGHEEGHHSDEEIEINNASKSEAEEACEEQEGVFEMNSEVEHAHCELK